MRGRNINTERLIVCLVSNIIRRVTSYPLAPMLTVLSVTLYFACRTIHKVASYLIEEEVAHNFHIIRGARCRPRRSQMNGFTHEDSGLQSVLRVFLWPRNPVHGKESLDGNSEQWLLFSADCRPTCYGHITDSFVFFSCSP